MLMLFTGGASCGKSRLAEEAALVLGGRRIYLATMLYVDAECCRRIARHRASRAGSGFETIERPLDLAGADIPAGSTLLLECLPNLAANELFDPRGAGEGAAHAIWAGIERLLSRCAHLIVVSNEVFSDGINYDQGTLRYLALLSSLNCGIAARADRVVEAVCGIAVVHKGDVL
jgi:adenosylcobinamide kinase/adenosylcobinamide-phosphate guanylyltransferase